MASPEIKQPIAHAGPPPQAPNAVTDSPGVKRIEVISAQLHWIERTVLFFGVFLIAYVYGLDGQVRITYQPTAAKIADVFGRIELIILSVVFYTVVCALPLLGTLLFGHFKAKRNSPEAYLSSLPKVGALQFANELFWYLDVVGVLLLIALLALILVPFTIAGASAEQWKTAKVIAPIVIGLLLVPAWIFWERYSKHPMVPFHGEYLYTVLVVSFGESITSATRITSLYSFASVITGCILGVIVLKVKRLKPFIVAGTLLFMVAYGILIYFRGGASSSSHSGVIGGQVLLGIAGGMFPYPAQASIQAATKHEHLAVITGIFLASYNVGSAIGNTIAGAIWRQTLLKELIKNLGDVDTATTAFGDPFTYATAHPMGTPERDAVVESYKHTQRLLCITGICLVVPLIAFACCIRNPRLTKDQSLPNAEERD
ncbi:hypothetical protein ATERTT37_004766 [Aspergillus terreus]